MVSCGDISVGIILLLSAPQIRVAMSRSLEPDNYGF